MYVGSNSFVSFPYTSQHTFSLFRNDGSTGTSFLDFIYSRYTFRLPSRKIHPLRRPRFQTPSLKFLEILQPYRSYHFLLLSSSLSGVPFRLVSERPVSNIPQVENETHSRE